MSHNVSPHLKISVIITVFNEEKTIVSLLEALLKQTYVPHEVVVVDAESSDTTLRLLAAFQRQHPAFPLHVYTHAGNRSQGRNYAVSVATGEWLAVTDAGCIPEPDWLEELVKALQKMGSSHPLRRVVAGYYRGLPKTAFQAAVVPYVLVMPRNINPAQFLPSTRSLLISKELWQEQGGLNETLEVSEDFELSRRLSKLKDVEMGFTERAVVGWMPRENLSQFFSMIRCFAAGDIKAGMYRPRVLLVFLRYIIMLVMLCSAWQLHSFFVAAVLSGVAMIGYSLWAIVKNRRDAASGWYWLPLLQFTADLAVMVGTLQALAVRVLPQS